MLCFGLQDSIGWSETSFLCTLGLHAAPGERQEAERLLLGAVPPTGTQTQSWG